MKKNMKLTAEDSKHIIFFSINVDNIIS